MNLGLARQSARKSSAMKDFVHHKSDVLGNQKLDHLEKASNLSLGNKCL